MAREYKGYNPKNAKHVVKYISTHYKKTTVLLPIDLFPSVEERAKAENLSVNAWINKLIREELEK